MGQIFSSTSACLNWDSIGADWDSIRADGCRAALMVNRDCFGGRHVCLAGKRGALVLSGLLQ